MHSLDAGDLSLTLGFTQLKLREGETLPRSKRIFHISPPDARHLEDICEFLIKFGYLIKSPVDPNGLHLYGMASYLVPRSKPGSLGRLVVDFSPINPPRKCNTGDFRNVTISPGERNVYLNRPEVRFPCPQNK